MANKERINEEVTQQDIPQIIHLNEVVSTNAALREIMQEDSLPEGSVVWSDYQLSGRGQAGNHWESEALKNLTFSVVLYPQVIEAKKQFLISQITALSVKQTLDRHTDGIRIKWPNDIYWNDKKICGMLIENDLTGHFIYCSVIGIGININQEVFHSKAPNPISLIQITNKKYHREDILDEFLSIFYTYYLMLLQEKEEEIRDVYRKALYRNDGFYAYSDATGTFEAVIDDIEPTGHLRLRLRDGSVRRYAFKEVLYK